MSSESVHIEQAFGVLVNSWGALWRSISVPVDKATQIFTVCCKIHNFIIDEIYSTVVPRYMETDIEGPKMLVIYQDKCV